MQFTRPHGAEIIGKICLAGIPFEARRYAVTQLLRHLEAVFCQADGRSE